MSLDINRIKGSIVALVTPMDGYITPYTAIDEDSIKPLVEFHIENETNAIVVVGTTGESATLTSEEHCNMITNVVDAVDGRIPVIAGTGSNSTHEAIFLTKEAKIRGADAALIVTPYYNKPTQKGLYEHFKTIAEKTNIPIIIYNIPGRSIVDMSVETMIELSKIKNIIGVKDATNDLFRPLLTRKKMQSDF